MNEQAQAAGGAPAIADRAWALIDAGGPVVVILLVMSVIAVTIVVAKLIQFRAVRVSDRRSAEAALGLWRAGRAGEALAQAAAARSPVAQALARTIRGVGRDLPEARVREEVVRYGSQVLETLRAGFRPLELIGSLAPLLGLFGTVLGMIEAFRQLESAGNQVDPAILSGGIWQALLTTAVGLGVAIPAVALLAWLERRVDRLALEMDDVVTRVFTEDLSETVSAPAKPSPQREDDRRHGPASLHATAAATGE